MAGLSVVIITYNEASNILRCITSARKVSADIVVVDSFSTDSTKEICGKAGVRLYEHAWKGYGDQKNYGNRLAMNDWILSLDADEELTDELAAEINAEMQSPSADLYYMYRISNFCGKWLGYTHWNPEKHIRIFNKNKAQWSEEAVHESLSYPAQAKIRTLKGRLLHYTIQNLEQYRKKNDHYIDLSARKLASAGKKPSFLKLYLGPAFRFVHSYILRLGVLDGYYGYVIARETARVTYLKYKKLKAQTS